MVTLMKDGDEMKSPVATTKAQDGSDENAEVESGVLTEKRLQAKRPPLYKVLLHNDDYTPMDFVIMVLETFFSKDRQSATDIMMNVHQKGIGICGIFPYEIAETKVAAVMECARENEHPLQCTMERE